MKINVHRWIGAGLWALVVTLIMPGQDAASLIKGAACVVLGILAICFLAKGQVSSQECEGISEDNPLPSLANEMPSPGKDG